MPAYEIPLAKLVDIYYGRIELRRIIMEETMLDYIKESSTLVRNNTLNSKELTKKAVEKYLTKDFNRIIIIASGSSYNGSYCARLFMEKLLKVKVDIITLRLSLMIRLLSSVLDKVAEVPILMMH